MIHCDITLIKEKTKMLHFTRKMKSWTFFICALYLLFYTIIGFADPPDAPLRPKEWIQKMGNGNWMIFNIEPDDFTYADVRYSEDVLDSLLSIGQTGGRLHFRPRSILDTTSFTYDTAAMQFLSKMIDDMTEREMGICLQYNPLWDDEEKEMTERAKKIYFNTWDQLCYAFRDKSHLLAMCPVIETHAWDQYEKTVSQDSLNWLYDSLTVIFRKYNPTRIISYKPWGAAKRAELYTLDFPFKGNHADPDSGYYVGSFSGSYGMGEWEDYGVWQYYTLDQLKEQTMQAEKLDKPEFGIRNAVRWREQTGIEVWMDHWEPDYWKNGDWTDEQNLAYTEFLLDTLQALGIASSGPQTRRIWDNEKEQFFQDDFTKAFIKVLKEHDWRSTVSVRDKDETERHPSSFNLNQNYPNPFNSITQIEFQLARQVPVTLTITDLLGQIVAIIYQGDVLSAGHHRISFNAGILSSGVYFYTLYTEEFTAMGKMLLLK